MSIVEILFISVALAMDAFAVSIASGTNRITHHKRPAFRLSFHFGLFQFMMPVIGWYLGSGLVNLISSFDHWLAFGLLSFIGIKMISESFRTENPSAEKRTDPTKGMSLIMLSIATSIDALVVGLSLAFLNINIWIPAVFIGIITAALSIIGITIGKQLGLKFGKKMEIAGGVILILIGIRILILHLQGG
ncbi:MAG TPA: manganese efflux pump MntP family protein [Ignavibacteria bacterium]|nr:manganese efflux pump MntP family protein [Ignavibacteria bacterium]